MKMKIDIENFQIPEGKKVNLDKWPTRIDPVYSSEDKSQIYLEHQVAKLSKFQQLH